MAKDIADFKLTDIINASLEDLMNESERVRTIRFGNAIELCAIVNIKNGHCAMNCKFCAQSRHHNADIETYPLLRSEKLSSETVKLWDQNIGRIGWVASGRTPTVKEFDRLIASAATVLTTSHNGCHLCASLGQLGLSELKRLKEVGFCRYHHNLETSERFYPSICTTQQWRKRRATVERVKELNWSVCCGGLFGLGETWEDRLQLALTLKELEVDSVPINFF
jgi:biotin synthase